MKEDALYWRAVTKHDEEKIAKRNSLNDFKILDSQKKQERAIKASEEVKQDYIKDNENFNEYLRHSKEMEDKRFGKANEIKTFWDKQSADLAENRRNRLQNDVDYQEATKKREAVGKYSRLHIQNSYVANNSAALVALVVITPLCISFIIPNPRNSLIITFKLRGSF